MQTQYVVSTCGDLIAACSQNNTWACADKELSRQLAVLNDQYAQLNDRLESEQTRAMQARLSQTRKALAGADG